MPIFARYTYSGVLGSAEVFSHGFHVRDQVATDAGGLLSSAMAWITTLTTTQFLALFPTDVRWSRVRVTQIDMANGETLTAAEDSVNISGTSANQSSPYEVSVCVSLRTAAANRKGRGRFYLPPHHRNVWAQGGLLGTVEQQTLVTSLGVAFDQLVTADRDVIIVGPVNAGQPALEARTVTRLDVGNVADAQRRRRNNLVEARIVHNIAV